jgi:hypothetical protein
MMWRTQQLKQEWTKNKQYAGGLKGFTLGQRGEGVTTAQVNTSVAQIYVGKVVPHYTRYRTNTTTRERK